MDGENGQSQVAASPQMRAYFASLQTGIDACYAIATQARKKGLDPEFYVEIPQALDLASRVEQLVGPPGVAPLIRQTTKRIGNRELVSLEIAREIVKGTIFKATSTEKYLDQAIRTGLAILTEGVLVAPLEGIADVKLGRNTDGTHYVDLYFSGPIRSAGGTGQAMSVLIADVVRRELNIEAYQASTGEIERYKEEIPLYKRVQHLQYVPTVDEIDTIVSHCPICINGEGTEDEEVTGYRDLPRVSTNKLRGGACLVIAEGLCLKAPKIWKHIKKLKLTGWDFLEKFATKGQTTTTQDPNEIPQIPPSTKYIGEVIAGRPVLAHPSRKGGFRLRYGRARTAGLASTAINPTTMHILDDFITVGTQMKTERPGKGTIGTPCTTIDGPILLLHNGDLVQANTPQETPNPTDIKQIIDVGELLIPYGEFLENNALLPDASYVVEWWIQDLQQSLGLLPEKNTPQAILDADKKTIETISSDLGHPIDLNHPTPQDALTLADHYHIPLHPTYTLFWHDITPPQATTLRDHILQHGTITTQEPSTLTLPTDPTIKTILIDLCLLHKQREGHLLIESMTLPLLRSLGITITDSTLTSNPDYAPPYDMETTIQFVTRLATITIKPRAPFRIGTRMGRPEKAAARKMRPPPHVLFPLKNYGGNQRLVKTAAENGTIIVEAGVRQCPTCNKKTYRITCTCGTHTKVLPGQIEEQTINLQDELTAAQERIGERTLPDTIKGVMGTISKHKTPEPLEKGILRAKHEVYTFKDGTIRFDMTDAPLTHFKPREIGVPLDRIRDLGYTKDYLGNDLINEDQICELKVQDVVISTNCAEYFLQVSHFIDDLLVKFYGLEKFYKFRKQQDLVGHLVVGLAPHTSAGALGRIIGFTTAQVCYTHPFYHATKRRNCLSPETVIHTITNEGFCAQTIEKLYQKTKSKETVVDDFGTTKKRITNVKAQCCNLKNGKNQLRKINAVIKTPASHHLIKLTLGSGRTMISSPAHRMIVWSNGKIIHKKMAEVNPLEDHLLVAQSLPTTERDIDNIDLLVEFYNKKFTEDLVVRGVRPLVDRCVAHLGGLQETVEILDCNKKTFSNYLYRDSIPLKTLLSLLSYCNKSLDEIPKNCHLGVKRDDTKIPRIIQVNKEFMRFLGYYLAEGHARATSKLCYQVAIAATEQEIREDVISCTSKVFNITPYVDEKSITVSSRLIYLLFTKILQAGNNAKTKRIPSQFISLPHDKIRELLRAYFAGDGSVEKGRLHVTCSSVHLTLLQDIGFQLLRFGIFYRIKEEDKPAGGLAKEFYEKRNQYPNFHLYYLSIRSTYAKIFANQIGFTLSRKQNAILEVLDKERCPRVRIFGSFILDKVKKKNPVMAESSYLYDIEVEEQHNFLINDTILSSNCDGDEDGLMLLMDALLNFSHSYIPDKRGGKMDLPLLITTRLDPSEVDKEAHNLDTLARYPLKFYESTMKHEHSRNLEAIMGCVSARLGTELQYEQFGFTHDTNDISEGPKESVYKTLKTMMDKMNLQLSLAAKIRAVDEADVAYKVIEQHFLPDIIGNLRAFSKQSVRCPTCNVTYRRIPLQGVCTKCQGRLTLTVHEMSVKKYLDISKEIAEKYNLPTYARQRISLVEKSIDSLFKSDKVKNTKLSDFF